MQALISDLEPYAMVITSVFSIAVLGFILRLSMEMKEIYDQRLKFVTEQLQLAKDELERLERVDKNVTKIGEELGLEGFGVKVNDIGDNFSGFIGRDNNKTQNIGDVTDNSSKFLRRMEPSISYEYKVDMIFTSSTTTDDFRNVFNRKLDENRKESWEFHHITAGYPGTESYILVFRRRISSDEIPTEWRDKIKNELERIFILQESR